MAFNKGSTQHTTDQQYYTINGLTGTNIVTALETMIGGNIAVSENNNQTNEYLASVTGNTLGNLTTGVTGSLNDLTNRVTSTLSNATGVLGLAATTAVAGEQKTAGQAINAMKSSLNSELQAKQGVPVVSTNNTMSTMAITIIGGVLAAYLVYRSNK